MDRNERRVRQPASVSTDSGADSRDTRSVVDWYFGRLVERFAGEHPVSVEQLLGALASVEREGRRRRAAIEGQGTVVPCPTVPGEVYLLPVELWHEFEVSRELSAAEGRAVRAVHRKMARSIAPVELTAEAAPFVFCAAPPELRAEP